MKPNLKKILASARAKPPAQTGEYGIAWLVELRFVDRDWYRERTYLDQLVDALAGTRWWSEMESVGTAHKPGERFRSPDDVKRALVAAAPGVVTVGHGEPAIALWHEDPEAVLKLDVAPSLLEIMFRLVGRALDRHRDAVLGDTIDALQALQARWRPDGRLAYAVGFPFPPNQIAYPRVRPPRTARRRLDAVADIVDPALPTDLVNELHVEDARAMAAAPVPDGVERRERDGTVAWRWVADPTDRTAMAAACALHERWIAPLIHSEVQSGWSEDGDLEVPIGHPASRPEPMSLVDGDDGTGYLDVQVGPGGELDEQAWSAAVKAVRKGAVASGAKIGRAAVVAQDRDAALRIAERARRDGLQPLYRKNDAIWDPFPPGTWQDPL